MYVLSSFVVYRYVYRRHKHKRKQASTLFLVSILELGERGYLLLVDVCMCVYRHLDECVRNNERQGGSIITKVTAIIIIIYHLVVRVLYLSCILSYLPRVYLWKHTVG